MAAPMRDSSLDGGHRAKVADPRTAATKADSATTNFGEYDDNEWDIGIGDLIIDLDADIEKTNEKTSGGGGGGPGTTSATMASAASAAAAAAAAKTSGKMAVEHSATVDKGLKMKIKRTKPGTKTSEAKHEIVKPGEQNGGEVGGVGTGVGGATGVMGSGGGNNGGSVETAVVNKGGKHPGGSNQQQQQQGSVASGGNGGGGNVSASSKRGSSGHRRDKARDKHGADKQPTSNKATSQTPSVTSGNVAAAADVNGIVRPTVQRVVFPVTAASGPGPPVAANAPGPPPPPVPPGTKSVDSAAQAVVGVNKSAPPSPAPAPPPTVTPPIVAPTAVSAAITNSLDDSKLSPPSSATSPPPPAKKLKPSPPDLREMVDVCVGTSVGTITEPDCLGPCEPGTSVTLEGIVWHETEGVLVVNVTWRGKTYVGTLLDCTRHDWAPPRFCDSPTSDLDARTPKGRGKRGRGATGSSPANDLSNFTETRSSVHSKLRSNNNGGAKGRRGPSSPTPFVPPRPDATPSKRKPRVPEDEAPSKKSRGPTPAPPSTPASASSSPPSSPVLLECPEPNCSKKYKHINGLKYHQSHAHGSADDEETKESASMSETEEEPSPAPHNKKEEPSLVENSVSPGTPGPTISEAPTPSPQQPPSTPTPDTEPPPTPDKGVVKPGVLRFGMQEESLLTVPTVNPTPRPIPTVAAAAISTLQPPSPASQPQQQPQQPAPTLPMTSQPPPVQLVIQPPPQQQQQQPPPLQQQQQQPQQPPPQTVHVPQIPVQQTIPQQNLQIAKVPQFKVKPASALMPDDKKTVKQIGHKKKNRKSPAGSPHPHPHPLDPPALGLEAGGREDVLSPAYSDISDDAAPLLEAEVDSNKSKTVVGEKKVEVGAGQSPQSMQHYGMYPYYGQPPYLVPSVTADNKSKESMSDKGIENKPGPDKEKKDIGPNVSSDYQQKLLQQHYYPYGYVPGYPYNLDTGYPVAMVATEEKGPGGKDEKSPGPNEGCKQNLPPAPTAIHVPNPNKVKTEPGIVKDKSHQNENHQILKESIEMKNQMSPAYLYSRQQQHQQQQQQTQQQQQQQQQQEDLRRYYIYPERRKEHSGQQDNTTGLKVTPPPQPKQTLPAPSPKHKDKLTVEDKKDDKVKQEGVKPTMETQGPPPPPTSSYAYIHSGYMQSPHYGAIPFDPGHPVYRGMNPMLVPGPYPNNPYLHPQLHPQLPRYHAPEDLSRPPPGPPKALDLLQHHANQYYSSHKIHELQERALKSPTPKTATSSSSPSGDGRQNVNAMSAVQGPPVSSAGPQPSSQANNKQQQGDNKDNRSPPPQRHVHTHHHTHVGLGYPILAGQYPAPYGAAVLASQQAAAVAATVINPYSPK